MLTLERLALIIDITRQSQLSNHRNDAHLDQYSGRQQPNCISLVFAREPVPSITIFSTVIVPAVIVREPPMVD